METDDPLSSPIGSDRFPSPRLLSEINVTPFVDVMLVLLIIFMITAPMVTTGLEVDLPDARASALASDLEPIEVSLLADGSVYINEENVAVSQVASRLQDLAAVATEPKQARVYVRASSGLEYGYVVSIVSQVTEAGFVKVTFLTEPAEAGRQVGQLEPRQP